MRGWKYGACSVVLSVLLGGCSQTPVKTSEGVVTQSRQKANSAAVVEDVLPSSGVTRKAVPYLEEGYARLRGTWVSQVRYRLEVDLSASTHFKGVNRLAFHLNQTEHPLTIDFNGGDVTQIQVNGRASTWEYNGWFITLPPSALSIGENHIEVAYTRPYATDGDGLHRYEDPVTQNAYVYTNFEPYNANKLFPHFDQPNIKATYELTVKAPENWEVISSTLPGKPMTHGGG